MQVYKAIKYIRLSYTDDKTVESDSVANQRRLICLLYTSPSPRD